MNKFKKNLMVGGLATTIFISSTNLSLAASMNNFVQVNSFNSRVYRDIKSSDWFYDDVGDAYRLSLMKGDGYANFKPGGTVTFAEAITLASRIHMIYNEKELKTSATNKNWYDAYVTYAKQNNILDVSFNDYNRNISRLELISMFEKTLPDYELDAINNISEISDLPENNIHKDNIIKLYNAGVVRGVGEMGLFMPYNIISRAETATLLNRMVDKSKRIKFELRYTEDLMNDYALKNKLKLILDDTFGYYLPRFNEGEVDENDLLNAFGIISLVEENFTEDWRAYYAFESMGFDTSVCYISSLEKTIIDNFTEKYFGIKVNHNNHRDLYVEEYYEDWAYLYNGEDKYYYSFYHGDAAFLLENHRIDSMKRLMNGDIEIKTTSYGIGMGEEETDEEKLVQISAEQGYNEHLLIKFREENGRYVLKEVRDI